MYRLIDLDYQQRRMDLIHLRIFALSGAVAYFCWYFVVEFFIPEAYNPFSSRLAVVLGFLGVFLLSYRASVSRALLQRLFMIVALGLTAHYFYLVYKNASDLNWVIGAFVTITAVSFTLISARDLAFYTFAVCFLSLFVWIEKSAFLHEAFFPGIVTVMFLINVGMSFRWYNARLLSESNERFRRLFNSTFECLVLHNQDVVVDANQTFCDLLGFKRVELLGKPVRDLVLGEDWPRCVGFIAAKSELPYELRLVRKDNTTVTTEVRGKEIVFGDLKFRMAAIRDITEQKRAERNRVMFESAQEAIRIRDEFISIAAHELRTPLTSVKLQLGMATRKLSKEDPSFTSLDRLQHFVALLDKQCSRLVRLVDNMLDVSRLSLGKITLNYGPLDFRELVREILDTMSDSVPITFVAPQSVVVVGDHDRLEQVCTNLITNALKYGEGKPLVVDLEERRGQAILRVIDQGKGIASENLDRIFKRFERAIPASDISGLGLGLYIARQIVELHEGNIEVQSELGKGSVFIVTLPLEPSAARNREVPLSH